MTTREYLGQLRNIDKRIKNRISEAEHWRDIAMSTGSKPLDGVKVQESKETDKMATAISLAVDYENESERLAKELIELKAKIIEQISGLHEEELHYNLLYGFYVNGKNYNELVVSENYSYRQIRRHFEEALKEFEGKYGSCYVKTPKKPKNA